MELSVQLSSLLSSEFLDEQVEAIMGLADLLSSLKCLGVPLYVMGEYLLDKLTLEERSGTGSDVVYFCEDN